MRATVEMGNLSNILSSAFSILFIFFAGFSLAVELKVSIPGADKDKVQALMEEAHTICPYSKATKGNIPVKLTVV